MNAYIVHVGDMEVGAMLVFHSTGRKARALAWQHGGWIRDVADGEYINLRSERTHAGHLEQERTTSGPEVIESPRVCPSCELWGGEPVIFARREDVYQSGEVIHEAGDEVEFCEFCADDHDDEFLPSSSKSAASDDNKPR